MNVAVIVFPGSNADWDVYHVVRNVLRVQARYVFHTERSLKGFDAVIIPGGFSYGDYLRCGAIARFSPVSEAIVSFAESNRPVLGICNGFQVLTELHLLPGALVRNTQLRFVCKDVYLKVNAEGPFTHGLQDKVLRMPVAHAEGRYHCDASTLEALHTHNQIAFRYSDADGHLSDDTNVNGSIESIAGIYNQRKNVMGLMPHPERASEQLLGSADGLTLFSSLSRFVQGGSV